MKDFKKIARRVALQAGIIVAGVDIGISDKAYFDKLRKYEDKFMGLTPFLKKNLVFLADNIEFKTPTHADSRTKYYYVITPNEPEMYEDILKILNDLASTLDNMNVRVSGYGKYIEFIYEGMEDQLESTHITYGSWNECLELLGIKSEYNFCGSMKIKDFFQKVKEADVDYNRWISQVYTQLAKAYKQGYRDMSWG